MSEIESRFKNLIPYLTKESIKVLHECSQASGREEISIPARTFPQLIDAAYMTTDYRKTSLYLSQIEQEALNDLLKKIFTYMYERANSNKIETVKGLTKDIVLLASNLHATVIANEPETKEEVKPNE